MKKSYVIIIASVVVVVGIFGWATSAYNGMVTVEEEATTAFAKVQSAYQRRADLIPNLVETVKGYATHEQTLDPDKMTPQKMKEFQEAQGELSSALGRLIAIQENYPDLKANENFRDLQVQLEGTENRINTERNNYNEAVQKYNVKIRRFPNSMFAGMFGFEKMQKFEAETGAEKAPQVKF